MTSKTETLSFGERLIKNTLGCYYVAGVIAVILAAVMACALVVGYSLVTIVAAVASLPLWIQGVVILVMIPFVVAVCKTIIETNPEAIGLGYCNPNISSKKHTEKEIGHFYVKIEKTAHDYSWVYLIVVYSSFCGGSDVIALETPNNRDAQRVGNDLLHNAHAIYREYKSKPSGIITEAKNDCELSSDSLSTRINTIEKKVEDLQKSKVTNTTPLPPLSELERQNKKQSEE